VTALALSAPALVYAHDHGQWPQWSQLGDDLQGWVKGLKNKNGVPCCDTADGFDAVWDVRDDHYRVRIPGTSPETGDWHAVPDDKVLDVPNRLGIARVWYGKAGSQVNIYCFLPGPQS